MKTAKNLIMIFGTFLVLFLLYMAFKMVTGYERGQSKSDQIKIETEFGTHEFAPVKKNQKNIPMH